MKSKADPRSITAFRMIVAIFLLFLCSLASLYLYIRFYQVGGVWMPGLMYTSFTVLVIWFFGIPLSARSTTLYYLLMIGLYIAVWFLTFASLYIAFITGIITAGLGALFSFYLTNRYLVKIKYENIIIFSWGGLAFLITDIIGWSFQYTPVQLYFSTYSGLEIFFTEVIVCWQLIVGIVWLRTLSRTTHQIKRR
ncbi:MAG: hypothetical protein NTW29_16045 [Bacteroidetes bacterium]|nr:hypothetical protein [Bacteroidota bacterium]